MSYLKDKIILDLEEAELKAETTVGKWPRLVRWILLTAVIIAPIIYFVAKDISKNIWSTRYAQQIPAAKPSFTESKDPEVSGVNVATMGLNSYTAVVKISNPNLELSADNISYKISFYDSNKQTLYSYTDKTFLLPDQTKYLVVPKFTTEGAIVYTDFSFTNAVTWQKRLNLPSVTLVASQPTSSEQKSPQAFVLEGNIYNNSAYQISSVRLTFVLFDSSGNIIGASRRDEYTLAPRERRTYKQLWPGITAPNLAKTEVYAETDSLNPDNLSVPDSGASNGASDLNRP